jgi:hypothetical protein
MIRRTRTGAEITYEHMVNEYMRYREFCGCPKEVVKAYGRHFPDCPERLSPKLPICCVVKEGEDE